MSDRIRRELQSGKHYVGKEEPHEFLVNAIKKVDRVLLEENKDPLDVAMNMIMQIRDRYRGTAKPSIEELQARLSTCVHKDQAENSKVTEEIDLDSLYNLLADYFIENFLKS